MINPLKALDSFVDEIITSASYYDAHASQAAPLVGSQVGWNVGSSNHNLNFVMSRQLTKSGSLMNGDAMLRIAAVYDSVRMISEDIAKLPLDMKERLGGSNVRTVNRHPLYRRISITPDEQIRAKTFWETMLAHACVWGNGYAIIERDISNGMIKQLQLVHPRNIVAYKTNGLIWYQYNVVDEKNNRTGQVKAILSNDMFHLHGVGDGVTGWPVVNFALESMGLTLSAETYQSAFMGNGGHISGVLQTDAVIKDKETKAQLVEQFAQKISGPNNVGSIPLLSHGMQYIPIDMKFTDAQLMETRQFQIEEIARWFRIPLHKLAILSSNATFNNIEQENQKYASDTLEPWYTRIEDEIKFKLLSDNSRFFAKFNTASLTRGDSKARALWNDKMFKMGSISPNEIRESEGLNSYDGGDEFYIPQNTGTVEEIQNRVELQQQAAELAAKQVEQADTDTDEEETNEDNSESNNNEEVDQSLVTNEVDALKYREVIIDSFQQIVQREVKFEENPKRDRAEFYERQAQLYTQKLAVHLTYLQMALPTHFIQKWAENHSMLNWQEEKAEQMADELITYYYKAQNYPDQVYTIHGKQVRKEGLRLSYV